MQRVFSGVGVNVSLENMNVSEEESGDTKCEYSTSIQKPPVRVVLCFIDLILPTAGQNRSSEPFQRKKARRDAFFHTLGRIKPTKYQFKL
jgi:hypothetical protein